MTEIDIKTVSRPQVVTPIASNNDKSCFTYRGYLASSPEQVCKKILAWFTNHIALSEQQALHELRIANLSDRIADLRRRGYVFHKAEFMEGLNARDDFFEVIYMLSRPIETTKNMPHPMDEPAAWITKVKSLIPNCPDFVDFNIATAGRVETYMLSILIEMMQARSRRCTKRRLKNVHPLLSQIG